MRVAMLTYSPQGPRQIHLTRVMFLFLRLLSWSPHCLSVLEALFYDGARRKLTFTFTFTAVLCHFINQWETAANFSCLPQSIAHRCWHYREHAISLSIQTVPLRWWSWASRPMSCARVYRLLCVECWQGVTVTVNMASDRSRQCRVD